MARRGARPSLRLVALLVAFSSVLLAIAGRLVQLQVVNAEPLVAMGARQRVRALELPAQRGGIFDRQMTPLALSTEARAIFANPRMIDEPAQAADALAPLLGKEPGELLTTLNRDASFVYLARKVTPDVAARIDALDLPYIGMHRESQRAYPAETLAGQLLGFVGVDDQGLSGIESKFDDLLRGIPGRQVVERDPRGRAIPQGRQEIVRPVPGKGIVLTIDRDIQFYAEQALARGIAKTGARNGVAVVLDTRTGDVLAMANHPPLDPSDFSGAKDHARRNRAVTDAYEPGSVNKVITAAAAIEAGVTRPDEIITVPNGLRIANKTFRDFESHPTLKITYGAVLARSSNIGTIKIALRLGKQRLYKALQAFGLTEKTGIEFPGETPGVMLPLNEWSGTSIGTIPIGQGIAVSPLQIASVYGTLANDGVRLRPRLVRGIVEPDGTVQAIKRAPGRRVVSAFTAAQVRGMLLGVVQEGTGKMAKIDGYLVGGKTGTARVPLQGRRGYSRDIITTFAGMAPVDDPRLVVLVALDNPAVRYAAVTAAPVFREIMRFSLAKLGVAPTVIMSERTAKRARRP